jgi:predicted DNA-binding transcriptional regulator AlpA
MTPLLTVTDVAELLRMSPRQVYGLTERKTREGTDNPVPFVKLHGNLRFVQADLEAWLARERKAA